MTISRPTTRHEFTHALIRYRWDRKWLMLAESRITRMPVIPEFELLTTDELWTWLHRKVCQNASFTDEMVREAFAEKEDDECAETTP